MPLDKPPTNADSSDESILRELADNSPIGILMAQDDSFVYANETSAQMLDIPLDKITQLSVEELAKLLMGDESESLLSKYYELVQGETHTQQGVFSFTDSEDNVRTIEITSQSLVFRGVRTLQTFLNDVSESVVFTKTLAESESRYRSLFENSPNSLWEEDFSETKRYIDEIKASGVEDFLQYFSQNPDELVKCVHLLKILDVNQVTLDLHSVETKEELIEGFSELLSEEAQPLFIKVFAAIAKGRTEFEGESEFITMSGQKRTQLLKWNVLPGYEDTYEKVILTMLDITERKQAEWELLESKKRFEALFDNSPISLWEEDFSEVKKHIDDIKATGIKDFRKYLTDNSEVLSDLVKLVEILNVNQATLDLYRFDSKEEIIAEFAGTLADDAKSLFIDEFTAIAEGKVVFESEIKHITVSGEKKHLLLNWSVQPGYEDTYEKIIVSIVDISERKQAENALLRERTVFGIIANAAVYSESMEELCQRLLVGLVETLDFDLGTVRLVNKTGTSLQLIASTGIEQMNCIHDISLVGGVGSDFLVAEVARSKSVIFATDVYKDKDVSQNLSRVRKLGIESIIFWPLQDAQGELIGVLNIASTRRKDLPEQDREFFKTLAEILTAAIERMLAKDEMQIAWARAELFNDLMAHDLNNVHQGLLTTLELMLIDESFPEKYRERAESALSQVQRSLDLIGNVRKFSQVDQADDLKLERTELYKVVHEAIDAVQQTFPYKILKPDIGIRADEYHVMVDEFLVDVLYNLFHNAMKFDVSETVEIYISAKKSDCAQLLEISIADKGPGMSDDQKQKLFSRLELKKYGGSGIGLTLVKRIIDRYNGEVFVRDRVEGEIKSGTCFIVRLPLVK